MKEKPILFSTEMVRAILDGKKTMTRRVIKPQPISIVAELKEHSSIPGYWIPYANDKRMANNNPGSRANDCGYYCKYKVGSMLWVRETWTLASWASDPLPIAGEHPAGLRHRIIYKFDEDMYRGNGLMRYPDEEGYERLAKLYKGYGWEYIWRPSIFMPRWASRITLEITGVRVERVQEITEEDAIAEGILPFAPNGKAMSSTIPRKQFAVLWDSINAKRGYSFESNPYVWVIRFKRVI